jgi:hypothetical protein
MTAYTDAAESVSEQGKPPTTYYCLRGTLDDYEVREISSHECARLLAENCAGPKGARERRRRGVD